MGKWTLERSLMVGALLVSFGINYGQVRARDKTIDDLEAFNQTLSARYVPREVYQINQDNQVEAMNRLSKQIENLTGQLEKLYSLERQTGEPASLQRRFDK